MAYSEEKRQEVVRLYEEGLTITAISSRKGMPSRKTVRNILTQKGIRRREPSAAERQECHQGRPDGTFRCVLCKSWKPSKEFRRYSDVRYKGGRRRVSYCDPCRLQNSRTYHANHREAARERHDRWRERCLAEGGDKAIRWYFTRQRSGYKRRAQKAGVAFDLSTDFLLSLFHSQKGRCYYTGEPLEYRSYGKGGPTPNSISVDRLVPSSGYVPGNVVLCLFSANTAKGPRTEEEFYVFCQRVLDRHKERQS